jgi:hypothetical protein
MSRPRGRDFCKRSAQLVSYRQDDGITKPVSAIFQTSIDQLLTYQVPLILSKTRIKNYIPFQKVLYFELESEYFWEEGASLLHASCGILL